MKRRMTVFVLLFGLMTVLLAAQTTLQQVTTPPTAGQWTGATVRVRIQTSQGAIVLHLYRDKAPLTVANFLAYVNAGAYNGTIFHRVIPNFMIQGGGFNAEMAQQPSLAPIQNEANNGLPNIRGSIAMARTNVPNSATSQFFINTADNAFLNYTAATAQGWGYAVFGRVVEGLDVVLAIEKVRTANRGGYQNVPVTPGVIQQVTVVNP